MTSNQKIVKGLAITLAVVIIIGIVNAAVWSLCSISFIFGNHTYDGATEIYNINDVDNIEINIGASNLKIEESDTFKIEIPNYVTYDVKNNKLTINEKSRFFLKSSNIKVYLPTEKQFDSVKINGGAGNIEIVNLTAKNVDFELGAGKVTVGNLEANLSFALDGGAGDFKLNSGYLNNADIDMGVGNFIIRATLNGKADIDMGVGNLDIDLVDEIDNYTFDIDKGIGNVTIDGKNVSGRLGSGNTLIEIDGGVGNIKIY
ncbi:MAG: DUF4097 family beta strand repeat protein [Bacilli bacterium]|nr:DUF4097 family beta strand repeat protein [Bacilli bacterium]